MRVVTASLAMALLMGSSATFAKEKNKEKNDPDKVICRSERSVGSNRSTRVCMTRAQWDHVRTMSKEMLDDSRDRAMASPDTGGG